MAMAQLKHELTSIPWSQALNLRVAKDPFEILSTLNKMFMERSQVLLWQNLGGMRVLKKCIISDIDYGNDIIRFTPVAKGPAIDFNKAYTIYIRGNEKSILFKQEKALMKDGNVYISIPAEVRLFEKRAHPRIIIGYGSKIVAHFEKRINQTNQRFREFLYNIYDLSKAGLSVVFNPKEQIYFATDDVILLHQLGDLKFPQPLEAQVVYIKKIEYLSDGNRIARMKMGLNFKRPISDDFLRRFSPR